MTVFGIIVFVLRDEEVFGHVPSNETSDLNEPKSSVSSGYLSSSIERIRFVFRDRRITHPRDKVDDIFDDGALYSC